MIDECGVCDGDGIADGACDCDGNVLDCAGECGGDALIDECGVCDGDGIADGACDCGFERSNAGKCPGAWMEFADLDGDGEMDCGCTSNENGGRASYIHYAEPIDKMVDASHLGYPAGKMHMTFLATEVLSTEIGTGMGYLLDTTDYEVLNGKVTFMPKLIHGYEIPFAEDQFHP